MKLVAQSAGAEREDEGRGGAGARPRQKPHS